MMTLKEKIQSFVNNLLDYGPILLTVLVGAYAAAATINSNLSDNELLQWILGILVLIATTQLVDRFRVLRSNDKKLDQILTLSQGTGGTKGFLLDSMPDLRERLKAAKSIAISGVSLAGTSNNYHPILQERLRSGIPVRLLVTDPDEKKPVADVAVYRIEKTQDPNVLRRSVNYSLETFSLLLNVDPKKKLKIRLLPFPTMYGIWMLDFGTDEAEIWVELYAFRKTPEPAFQLLPRRDGEWYEFFADQFEKMWAASNDWDVINKVKIVKPNS